MTLPRTQIGEAFVGEGAEAAHVNTVLGAFGGPVETAWVSALARPSAGHTPFLTVLQPGLPVKPLTLFVNKAARRRNWPPHFRVRGPAIVTQTT